MEWTDGDAPARWPGWTWTPRDRKTAWFCALLALLFAAYFAGMLEKNLRVTEGHPFGDFFALWSYAKILVTRSARELYGMAQLHADQVALGMPPDQQNPFPYPPIFLLILWPLGFLSFWAAYVVWMGASLPMYLLATCMGVRSRTCMLFAALLAPTTTACLSSGQSGFLLAGLLVGGLRLIPSRPVLAGILFGLLTYKPQFGMLVPVALVATGQWRCIAAACVTTASLFFATAVAFGTSIWGTWWHVLSAYEALFSRGTVANHFMPTVLTNLQMLALPDQFAWAAQIAAALAAVAVVWKAWRSFPHSLAVPVLLAATCLATPHAFIYDFPMLSSAVLLFIAHRLRSTGSLVLPEIVVLVTLLAIPEIMSLRNVQAPISTIAIALFLGLALMAREVETGRQQALSGVHPVMG